MTETADTAAEPIRFETHDGGVARIVLARPEVGNAQDKALLYALNDAFDRAAHDDAVKVIILAGEGKHFSTGHDMRDRSSMRRFEPVGNWGGFRLPGAEGHMAFEHELYLGMCWRWRNLPKPTIAEVQGRVIAAGLMLVWVCDLVVAADNAQFSDPVVAFGVNGVEYFAHPWEVGVRKAKEMLFTGEAISAEEARALGMVNRVVPLADLPAHTLALAQHIAKRPSIGLKLAKQSVNQMQDAQGLWTALQSAMSLQQLGHAHNRELHGFPADPAGAQVIRDQLTKDG